MDFSEENDEEMDLMYRYIELEEKLFLMKIDFHEQYCQSMALLDVLEEREKIIGDMEMKINEDSCEIVRLQEILSESHENFVQCEDLMEHKLTMAFLHNKYGIKVTEEIVQNLENNLFAQLTELKEQFEKSDAGNDFIEILREDTELKDTITALKQKEIDLKTDFDKKRTEDEASNQCFTGEMLELEKAIASEKRLLKELTEEKVLNVESCLLLENDVEELKSRFIQLYKPEAPMQIPKMSKILPLLTQAIEAKASHDQIDQTQKLFEFPVPNVYWPKQKSKGTLRFSVEVSPKKAPKPSKISSRNPSTESISGIDDILRKPSGRRSIEHKDTHYVMEQQTSSQVKMPEKEDLSILKTSSQKRDSSQGSNTSKKSFLEELYERPKSQEMKLSQCSQEQKPKKSQKTYIASKQDTSDAGNIFTGQEPKIKISPKKEEENIAEPIQATKENIKRDHANPKPKEIPEGKRITVLKNVIVKPKPPTPPLKSPSERSIQGDSEMNFDMDFDFGNIENISDGAGSESAFSFGGGDPTDTKGSSGVGW